MTGTFDKRIPIERLEWLLTHPTTEWEIGEDVDLVRMALSSVSAGDAHREQFLRWVENAAHLSEDDRMLCRVFAAEHTSSVRATQGFAALCRPAVKSALTKAEMSLLGKYPEHYKPVLEAEANRMRALLDEIDAIIDGEHVSASKDSPRFEDTPVAWLVEYAHGGKTLVFSPLTDDVVLMEGDEASPLHRRVE